MKIAWPFLLFLTTAIVASAQDPVKVDPAHYRLVFENAHMRVLEYRDKPGDKAPMHSHPAYMTYVTGVGRTKVTLPDGETRIDESAGSEFDCHPPTQHATENVGTTDTQELLVEFKASGNPCSGDQREASSSNAGEGVQAEEEVRRAQDALIDAYIHRDVATLDRILADEYTFTNDDGTVSNKLQTLDSFKSGDRQVTSYKRQDDRVRVYGDTAAMTYRYQSKETYKGGDESSDDLLTRIFVKRDGRWQMVSGHETRVPSSERGGRDRLIGTWRLASAGTFRSDGTFEPYPEYGPNPIGYLMYDPTGHMCVSLANPNHPHWANAKKPTDAEKLRSYDVFFAYCGTYEVRDKENRVIHRPEMGSWPHYIGTDQNRNFRLEGDRLILWDEETPPSGERRRYQITWERIRQR